ncbi:HAD family hydrolase [Pseudomonas savastanoi]|uniref:HAD family hydrolase n=1 Tax=Pseudomonas savastanoi TaxID=29438 RepID=UPI000AB01F51|nr:HAD family phosphatase [Pseudomonas savastanoi]
MTAQNFSAVCFDMDGVLIHSRNAIERAWTDVAYDYGINVSKEFIHHHIHGRPGEYTLKMLFGEFNNEQRGIIKKQVDAAEESAPCALMPGVAILIAHLHECGVPLALVTSSWPQRIENVLRQHGLGKFFDCVVSREDVKNGKPAPDCYELAAQKLARKTHQCLVFEDSSSGVRSAVSSGALCLGIGGETSLLADGAAAVYADFNILPVASSSTNTHSFDGRGLILGTHVSRSLL